MWFTASPSDNGNAADHTEMKVCPSLILLPDEEAFTSHHVADEGREKCINSYRTERFFKSLGISG